MFWKPMIAMMTTGLLYDVSDQWIRLHWTQSG